MKQRYIYFGPIFGYFGTLYLKFREDSEVILSFPVSSKYYLVLKMQKIVDSFRIRKIMACYMKFFSNVIMSCPGR